ncbi:MAG: TlpA family protein disulfide reductase [Kangiellaceae bacterium]|nr:TlpA family protein disulfide reductase [Kangiellaceae bacterium]
MKKTIALSILFLALSFDASCYTENIQANQPFNIQQYKGKVVYLDFWASWCVPCRKSFPWMNKIQAKHSRDKFVVVTVNLDKKKELATDFLKQYPANFQVIYDPKGELAKKYQVKGMPSSILFNSQGKAVSAHKGFFSKKIPEYETEIRELIQANKS